jgi:hypothetical protein
MDWSDPTAIFDPSSAYGIYMHSGPFTHPPDTHVDDFNHTPPPAEDPNKPETDGFAYGAFILNRFTEAWDETKRELGIYYLLSLSSPYQVQLMYSRLRLG